MIAASAVIFILGLLAMLYLLGAAIFPETFPLTQPIGISEISAVATAAPAASLALLTTALVLANFYLAGIAAQDLQQTVLAVDAATEEAIASTTLAREAVADRTAQWEPYVNARVAQPEASRPLSVELTNLGRGPAIDCVYVVTARDDRLEIWYTTKPVDILSGERKSMPLGGPDLGGFDQMEYVTTDEQGGVDPQGRRLRRHVRRYKTPFDGDTLFLQSTAESPPTRIGFPSPDATLFRHEDGSGELAMKRQEAVICACANGHVHRTLPHLRKQQETFRRGDTRFTWLSWYEAAREGRALPTPVPFVIPEPQVISTEPMI